MDKRKLTYYSLIGTALGGVTGLVPIIACLNFFSLVDGVTYGFVIINMVALTIGFCAAYLTILKSAKSLDWFKTKHWILINASIGAIFGLLVGYFANTGEIYWFVIGFAIISLIPVVNFLVVAFWLGAAIYGSYYPIDLIPILNDILPIHLTDTSMIWITGLPLFAVPLFAFLGYWMVGIISGSRKKRVSAPTKIIDRRGLKGEMGRYKSKLSGWKNEGYSTSELEESLKSGNLLSKIQNLSKMKFELGLVAFSILLIGFLLAVIGNVAGFMLLTIGIPILLIVLYSKFIFRNIAEEEEKVKKGIKLQLKNDKLDEIKTLIKETRQLDKVKEKIQKWKDEGYDVSELEDMVGKVNE